MKQVLIHVPHASMYIPEEYRQTALIPQEELEEENCRFRTMRSTFTEK